MAKVNFVKGDKAVNLKNTKNAIAFIKKIFNNEEKKFSEITFIFCSNEFMLKLNNEFLNHDYFTDIITFDISDMKDLIKGEIYLGINTIQENAKIYNKEYDNELLRVIIHGILHLCGYNDKTNAQQTLMRQKENFYLNFT